MSHQQQDTDGSFDYCNISVSVVFWKSHFSSSILILEINPNVWNKQTVSDYK